MGMSNGFVRRAEVLGRAEWNWDFVLLLNEEEPIHIIWKAGVRDARETSWPLSIAMRNGSMVR